MLTRYSCSQSTDLSCERSILSLVLCFEYIAIRSRYSGEFWFSGAGKLCVLYVSATVVNVRAGYALTIGTIGTNRAAESQHHV